MEFAYFLPDAVQEQVSYNFSNLTSVRQKRGWSEQLMRRNYESYNVLEKEIKEADEAKIGRISKAHNIPQFSPRADKESKSKVSQVF